jgi:hypothetical protein
MDSNKQNRFFYYQTKFTFLNQIYIVHTYFPGSTINMDYGARAAPAFLASMRERNINFWCKILIVGLLQP